MTNETVRKVPELSLLNYINGSSSDQISFVDNLMYGLKEYGFIVLKDHTVDQHKVDKAYEYLSEFYALPVSVKEKYCANNGGQRGYTPFKVEHAKDNDNPDLKEFWHVGRELAATSPYKGIYPENIWPTEVPEFKNTFNELYNSMDATSVVLLEAIGKGLDLPENYFRSMVNDGNSILRAIHYPPTKGEDTKNSIRAAAHEDINLITMLVGATESGLELLDKDGTWLAVQSSPGEIVVDTGDMMSRLTNNVLPATTHRVVNPTNDGSRRFSMPFFVHPHSNANLSCVPSCIGDGAKFEDITAGDFLIQRLKEIGLY
ncbi:isopenicillin N synthase family oxygenase [Halobacteriovorax sp. HLS]|uniref:isopenicillin N synthase family dioxygenase n=1 Tax=Halobacteriovorax sp. HLS TaxID=2234000 RepID=UPI0019D4E4CF|nr:isopenicillin N synthase family oxygenase [Halobacteriovorax sp. HLS]